MMEDLFIMIVFSRFNKKEILVKNDNESMKAMVNKITQLLDLIGISRYAYTIKFEVVADYYYKEPRCRVYLVAK